MVSDAQSENGRRKRKSPLQPETRLVRLTLWRLQSRRRRRRLDARVDVSPAPEPLPGWSWVAGGLEGPQLIPLGKSAAFDSHVCFAAAVPVTTDDGERLYYMAGNGPHSGDRNSSFGLATLRRHGYAGVRGSGTATTKTLLCTGRLLTVTADAAGGSFAVGVSGAGSGVSLLRAVRVTTNVTDFAVSFDGGGDFAGYVGHNVTLDVAFDNAALYTLAFTDDP